jgi:hypothetical protein
MTNTVINQIQAVLKEATLLSLSGDNYDQKIADLAELVNSEAFKKESGEIKRSTLSRIFLSKPLYLEGEVLIVQENLSNSAAGLAIREALYNQFSKINFESLGQNDAPQIRILCVNLLHYYLHKLSVAKPEDTNLDNTILKHMMRWRKYLTPELQRKEVFYCLCAHLHQRMTERVNMPYWRLPDHTKTARHFLLLFLKYIVGADAVHIRFGSVSQEDNGESQALRVRQAAISSIFSELLLFSLHSCKDDADFYQDLCEYLQCFDISLLKSEALILFVFYILRLENKNLNQKLVEIEAFLIQTRQDSSILPIIAVLTSDLVRTEEDEDPITKIEEIDQIQKLRLEFEKVDPEKCVESELVANFLCHRKCLLLEASDAAMKRDADKFEKMLGLLFSKKMSIPTVGESHLSHFINEILMGTFQDDSILCPLEARNYLREYGSLVLINICELAVGAADNVNSTPIWTRFVTVLSLLNFVSGTIGVMTLAERQCVLIKLDPYLKPLLAFERWRELFQSLISDTIIEPFFEPLEKTGYLRSLKLTFNKDKGIDCRLELNVPNVPDVSLHWQCDSVALLLNHIVMLMGSANLSESTIPVSHMLQDALKDTKFTKVKIPDLRALHAAYSDEQQALENKSFKSLLHKVMPNCMTGEDNCLLVKVDLNNAATHFHLHQEGLNVFKARFYHVLKNKPLGFCTGLTYLLSYCVSPVLDQKIESQVKAVFYETASWCVKRGETLEAQALAFENKTVIDFKQIVRQVTEKFSKLLHHADNLDVARRTLHTQHENLAYYPPNHKGYERNSSFVKARMREYTLLYHAFNEVMTEMLEKVTCWKAKMKTWSGLKPADRVNVYLVTSNAIQSLHQEIQEKVAQLITQLQRFFHYDAEPEKMLENNQNHNVAKKPKKSKKTEQKEQPPEKQRDIESVNLPVFKAFVLPEAALLDWCAAVVNFYPEAYAQFNFNAVHENQMTQAQNRALLRASMLEKMRKQQEQATVQAQEKQLASIEALMVELRKEAAAAKKVASKSESNSRTELTDSGKTVDPKQRHALADLERKRQWLKAVVDDYQEAQSTDHKLTKQTLMRLYLQNLIEAIYPSQRQSHLGPMFQPINGLHEIRAQFFPSHDGESQAKALRLALAKDVTTNDLSTEHVLRLSCYFSARLDHIIQLAENKKSQPVKARLALDVQEIIERVIDSKRLNIDGQTEENGDIAEEGPAKVMRSHQSDIESPEQIFARLQLQFMSIYTRLQGLLCETRASTPTDQVMQALYFALMQLYRFKTSAELKSNPPIYHAMTARFSKHSGSPFDKHFTTKLEVLCATRHARFFHESKVHLDESVVTDMQPCLEHLKKGIGAQ